MLLPFLFTACSALAGEEVGRIKVNEVSDPDHIVYKEITIALKKNDEIGIWSDMDIAYEGDVAMRFQLGLWKDGKQMGVMEIDPTENDMTLDVFKKSINGKTEWSFKGRNKNITIGEDGNYTFKAAFGASDNKTLKVNKAEIMLKKL